MKLVEGQGRRIVARQADVRDADAVDAVVAEGVAEFGRLDIVIANAGIIRVTDSDDRRRRRSATIVEVNLIGAWNTVDAAIPALIAGGRGGSIVLTSSTQGIKASGTDRPGLQAYAASKRGLVALMQGWAMQLAPHSIRVNTIHPSGVATDMIINEATMALAAANDPWLASPAERAAHRAAAARARSRRRWRGWSPMPAGSSPAPRGRSTRDSHCGVRTRALTPSRRADRTAAGRTPAGADCRRSTVPQGCPVQCS